MNKASGWFPGGGGQFTTPLVHLSNFCWWGQTSVLGVEPPTPLANPALVTICWKKLERIWIRTDYVHGELKKNYITDARLMLQCELKRAEYITSESMISNIGDGTFPVPRQTDTTTTYVVNTSMDGWVSEWVSSFSTAHQHSKAI